MQLLSFLLVSAVFLSIAYWVFVKKISPLFHLNNKNPTPAHRFRDNQDFEPIQASSLLPQHFSAIAAAGPIVGPILAGLYFGWGPAWIWIIVGSIFIGGIHDFASLLGSVRHQGLSIAVLVKQYLNERSYRLFLIFIWFTLIYVVIAFTDVTASTFVAAVGAEDAPGPAVASASLGYLGLALLMGLTVKYTKLKPLAAKILFLPLVFAIILGSQFLPLDPRTLLGIENVQQFWGYTLLIYCFFASLLPCWLLLQPRGELGGYFLYIVMGIAVVGIFIASFDSSLQIQQPFFKGFIAKDSFGDIAPLFPILFITVACGACSGFHSVVASGTTSKQISRETESVSIGYGSMLLEGFLACISLATFMIFQSPSGSPSAIYAQGVTDFTLKLFPAASHEVVRSTVLNFALLCFATFVFDTLDACTRLSRYIFMEFFNLKTQRAAMIATLASLTIPSITLSIPPVDFEGKAVPLYRVFWNIFGSSNQLLAALTLMAITAWFLRKNLPAFLTAVPMVFMFMMTLTSLGLTIPNYFRVLFSEAPVHLLRHWQAGINMTLFLLATWMLVEAWICFRKRSPAKSDVKL